MATDGKPAAGEEDLSMEEILQSIRKIIADDDDGKDTKNGAEVPGSDVLELTEMIEEAPAKPVAAPIAAAPVDVLGQIDAALSKPEKPVEKAPEPVPVAKVAENPPEPPKPVENPVPPAAQPTPQDVIDSLMSAQAAAATAAAFQKIEVPAPPLPDTTPSPQFMSGKTVEGMVYEMLKPMLKEWLDANLSKIVERIVEIEVKRLSH